jgi:hypothetical protein
MQLSSRFSDTLKGAQHAKHAAALLKKMPGARQGRHDKPTAAAGSVKKLNGDKSAKRHAPGHGIDETSACGGNFKIGSFQGIGASAATRLH